MDYGCVNSEECPVTTGPVVRRRLEDTKHCTQCCFRGNICNDFLNCSTEADTHSLERECSDVKSRFPKATSDVYMIYPDGTLSLAVAVYCYIDTNGDAWTEENNQGDAQRLEFYNIENLRISKKTSQIHNSKSGKEDWTSPFRDKKDALMFLRASHYNRVKRGGTHCEREERLEVTQEVHCRCNGDEEYKNTYECPSSNCYGCQPNPCPHGVCTDYRCTICRQDEFVCSCYAGYTGQLCHIDIDDCQSSPCIHGKCTDLVNMYTCTCDAGYTGTQCKIDIDECASNPCLNGATCIDNVNGFTCKCSARYYGILCETGICQPSVSDLIFVLDSSVSQTEAEFNKQLDFIINFVDHIVVGEEDFQVAVVTFSYDAQIEINLTDHHTKDNLKAAIRKVRYRPGVTYTYKGLEKAKQVANQSKLIERHYGKTANRYVFVLTDGMSTYRSKTRTEAKKLKAVATKVIAIGIGKEVSHEELLGIASPGDNFAQQYVFSVNNFNCLYSIIKPLLHSICKECIDNSISNVMFLLDIGINMHMDEFQLGLDAITYLVNSSNDVQGNHKLNLGLLTAGDETILHRNFNTGSKAQYLQTLVLQHLQCDDECDNTTRLHEGLKEIKELFDNIKDTSTDPEQNTRNYVVILTNGQFDNNTLLCQWIANMQKDNIDVFVIGLGIDVDTKILLPLVTDPYCLFLTQIGVPPNNLAALFSEFIFSSCNLSNEF